MDGEDLCTAPRRRRTSTWKGGSQPAKSSLDLEGSAEQRLQQFLEATCGSSLWAWLNVFDVDNDQRINKLEFCEGMRLLNYPGKVSELFAELDHDGSGEITMEEIDLPQSYVWSDFRDLCVEIFDSVHDMLESLHTNRISLKGRSKSWAPHNVSSVQVTEAQFTEAVGKLGWTGANAKLLFSALCSKDEIVIRSANLKWLGIEHKRLHKKFAAKKKVAQHQKRQKTVVMLKARFDEFKTFLKRKHGNLVRVWRTLFHCNDSLLLSKPAFLKSCAAMGYASQAQDLWKMLDADNSGIASLDEMDPNGAEVLAKFKSFIDSKFSSVSEAFCAIDIDNQKTVKLQQFDTVMKQLGWTGSTKQIFRYLDKDSNKTLVEPDLKFLEKWSPLPYLLVHPNEKAKEEVKRIFMRRHKNPLKAWRNILDKDGDNHVNWDEFLQACKHFAYKGDIAGAWRAFDDDLSGFISMQEFDSETSECLLEFRAWCHEEFGNVESAFGVIDDDGSNSLSLQEFRGACRIYGFRGDIRRVFDCFDTSNTKNLSRKDIVFLDNWEVGDEDEDEDDDHHQAGAAGNAGNHRQSVAHVVKASVAQDAAAADGDEEPDEPKRGRFLLEKKVDDPMRLVKVMQVKQKIQKRFDMKLPPLLRNAGDDGDHCDGEECVREDQFLPTSIQPFSARTPRRCQARKCRERKPWKIKDMIKDPDQCRQFWLNHQMDELSNQQQQEIQAMSPETPTADVADQVELDAEDVEPRDELASPAALLKPTLDQLLQGQRDRSSLKRKGHSHGRHKQPAGNGLSKLPPLLPEIGGRANQKDAWRGAMKMKGWIAYNVPFTAR